MADEHDAWLLGLGLNVEATLQTAVSDGIAVVSGVLASGETTPPSAPPPENKPAETMPNRPGPQPVTDVDVVKTNVNAPGKIKTQAPEAHQADWTAQGGEGKAPLAYRDAGGNVYVSTDHPLMKKKGVIPPVRPGENVGTATPGASPPPAKPGGSIGTADTQPMPAAGKAPPEKPGGSTGTADTQPMPAAGGKAPPAKPGGTTGTADTQPMPAADGKAPAKPGGSTGTADTQPMPAADGKAPAKPGGSTEIANPPPMPAAGGKTPAKPGENPPAKPAAGGGTAADSQPPLRPQKQKAPVRVSPEEWAEAKKKVADMKFPPQPGDGEPVPLDQAFRDVKSGNAVHSGNHKYHETVWKEWLHKEGEPPVAFKFSGKTQIDVAKLTPDQLAEFIRLDKLANPSAYSTDDGEPGPKPADGKGPGDKPAEGAAGIGKKAQELAKKMDDFQARAAKLNEELTELAKRQSDHQAARQKQGEGNSADLDKAEQELSKELAELGTKAQGTKTEGETLAQEGREISKGGADGKFIGSKLGELATALSMVNDIIGILQAGSPEATLKQTAKVEAGLLQIAAFQTIFKAFCESDPVLFVAVSVVGWSGERSPTAAETKWEEEGQQQQQQAKEEAALYRATGATLEKTNPGSVTWLEDHYQINDQQLFDRALVLAKSQWAQIKKEAAAAKLKQQKIHAHYLGVEDGMTDERTQKDDAVPKASTVAGVPGEMEINAAYESGFKEGEAAMERAMKRAHDLGAKDRKDGKPAQTEPLENFAEYEVGSQRLVAAYLAGYAS